MTANTATTDMALGMACRSVQPAMTVVTDLLLNNT